MKTLAAIIVILVVIFGALLLVYFGIPAQEPYGYWKPDKDMEKQLKDQITIEFPEADIFLGTKENSGYRPDVRWAEIYSGIAGDMPTNEEEAKQIAINFILSHSDFFGISEKELEIKEVSNREGDVYGWDVDIEIQTYADIPVCYSGGGTVFYKDGGIAYVTISWYQNVSAPTTPKISKSDVLRNFAEMGITVEPSDIGDKCIYPLWHSDGEYWTYHLAWPVWEANYIDAITGDFIFSPRPID